MTSKRWLAALALGSWMLVFGSIACSSPGTERPLTVTDTDAGGDAGAPDGGLPDAAPGDAGSAADAADGGALPDAQTPDAGSDAAVAAGPPSLDALSVSSAADAGAPSPVTLVPAFSPDVHDYSVRCVAGTNDLSVSMTASSGSSGLLLQPTPSASQPQQTLAVSVTENQAIVVAATNATATVEYWVRCLPHDFPLLQWAPHPQAGTPTPGYYLIGTAQPTTSGCYAIVLDPNGVPVWYSRAQPVLGWCMFDVDSVVSGTVSFDSLVDYPAQFEIHGLDPLTTTKVMPAGMLNVDLHELRLLQNGDYLVISSPLQPGVDLTGMQVPLPDGTLETLSGPQSIMACNLLELRPDGTVVWTWNATDHFDALADSVTPQLLPYGPNATLVPDPFHCNSIDVDPTSGNLLVSARQMNSIFEIERSSGRVLWKMGGATASKDGATYVPVADPFALQHDARFQPDWSSAAGGSGHISLFDDETYGAARPARAVVYDVTVGAGDGGAGAATVAWQRPGPGPSLAMGSFRILPDGSRVIGWGSVPGAGFTEVDAGGTDLADLTFPDGNTTYRALKVPLGSLDLDALRSTAGLP